jgi:hypothetical protein
MVLQVHFVPAAMLVYLAFSFGSWLELQKIKWEYFSFEFEKYCCLFSNIYALSREI